MTRLCLPTNNPDPDSIKTAGSTRHSGHSNNPKVGKSTVVPRSPSLEETGVLSVSPEPRPVLATRLQVIRRSLKERGFSRRVGYMVSRSIRKSSSKIYNSRWEIFCVWCTERRCDPGKATKVELADFILHLVENKMLSLSSISGYMSATSTVQRVPTEQHVKFTGTPSDQRLVEGD